MGDRRENTPVHSPVQGKVYVVCAEDDSHRESEPMATKDTERGGHRLDRILKAHGLTRGGLAKKVGVAPSTVQKWFNALQKGEITDESWMSCARALQLAGIDPQEVRPGAPIPVVSSVADLIHPIMDVKSKDILELLARVLALDSDHDRTIVRELVNAQMKKI